MATFQRICPKSKEPMQFHLEDTLIHFNCQCGYQSTLDIKDYKIDTSKNIFKDKDLSDMSNTLNSANLLIQDYFKTLKDEQINRLNSLIKQLETSYQESFNKNKKMLAYIQVLFDNYDQSAVMKRQILSNHINIYKCKETNNVQNVIHYYSDYNIIGKINIDDVKCIRTITEHTYSVESLLLLKEKKVASSSYDETIRIYDPSNDYHCDSVLNRHRNYTYSICQLDDGTIVSCSSGGSIQIGDYKIWKAHNGYSIYKVIPLPDNRIASCSDEKTVTIWTSEPPYSDTPIIVLKGHSSSVKSILYIKERDILISGSQDDTLRLWSMTTYKFEKVINGVKCDWSNALYQIDNDRVIAGGQYTFSIVNIDDCVIENQIINESFGYANCFIKLRDNTTILCGCGKGQFCFYDLNTSTYKMTMNNHNDSINALLLMDNNTFISCSSDNTIKVWNY